jgi:hypothetical protein
MQLPSVRQGSPRWWWPRLGGVGQVVSRQHLHLSQTQDWLMRHIACMLAGRTAKLLVFGEALVGTGGSDDSDLAKANEYAVAAETRLGFSSHQPLLYRSPPGSINELSLDRHLAERVNNRLLGARAGRAAFSKIVGMF